MDLAISPALQRIRETSSRPAGAKPLPEAVDLSMGEPDFDAPRQVVEALYQALLEGHTHYGNLNGDPELRALLAQQASDVRKKAGVFDGLSNWGEVVPDQISIGHGATGILAAIIVSLIGPGDRVVLPEPTYSLYSDLVEMVGGEVFWVPLDENQHVEVDNTLAAARTSKMLILCNPGNPTGAVVSAETLAMLGEGLAGTDTIVVSDEAYRAFTYGQGFTSALAVPELAERLIQVDTLSKTYALTGFRLGWSVAPQPIAQAISQVGRTIAGAPNAAVQKAAISALSSGDELYAPMLEEYAARRDLVVKELGAVPGVEFSDPEGAFYAFFRHGLPMPSAEVRAALAGKGVLLRSGSEYGPSGEGYLRMSFAASEEQIREGIRRIKVGFDELRE